MKVITEADLMAKYYKNNDENICLQKDDFLTQPAKDYIRNKGIKIVYAADSLNYKIMEQESKIIEKICYYDKEGNNYNEKPEYMTALHGNLIIPKSHPLIAFRGKLDSLQGKILETQIIAERNEYFGVVFDLEEILIFVRDILACEVKETPINITSLLGLNDESLRNVSHNPKKFYGIDHYMPNYKMGETVIALNSLRTIARETELSGINTFKNYDGEFERPDIIRALNRLSSAIYIISCRFLANFYNKK